MIRLIISTVSLGILSEKQVDFRKLTEKLSTSLRKEAMTTYEQAVHEGNIEKENLVITNAYKKGLDISFIADLTSLTEAEVTDRIKELGLEK